MNRKHPDSSGVILLHPPKAAGSFEPRRAIRKPMTRNKAPVDRPWLTMYRTAPVPPWDVRANVPRAMNPKCAMDV